MIVLHEYPLAIVDHFYFRKFLSVIRPFFKCPSRNTIKRDIFNIFISEKIDLRKLIEALTTAELQSLATCGRLVIRKKNICLSLLISLMQHGRCETLLSGTKFVNHSCLSITTYFLISACCCFWGG
ncbi:hypothetical protein LINPERPRIM_LOCUS37979 [Linum perenne]